MQKVKVLRLELCYPRNIFDKGMKQKNKIQDYLHVYFVIKCTQNSWECLERQGTQNACGNAVYSGKGCAFPVPSESTPLNAMECLQWHLLDSLSVPSV